MTSVDPQGNHVLLKFYVVLNDSRCVKEDAQGPKTQISVWSWKEVSASQGSGCFISVLSLEEGAECVGSWLLL